MKDLDRNQLSPDETTRRAELEAIIVPGIRSCIEVGQALREMSDRRLYRNTHSTFKEYVEEVYKIGVRTAYELVEHADLVTSLPAECAKFAQTATPAQTRALKKVPTEKRAEVLEAASSNGPVTAAAIKEAAAEIVPPVDERTEPEAEEQPEPHPLPFDERPHAFAAQVEDIVSDAEGTATLPQLQSLLGTLKESVRKIRQAINRLKTA